MQPFPDTDLDSQSGSPHDANYAARPHTPVVRHVGAIATPSYRDMKSTASPYIMPYTPTTQASSLHRSDSDYFYADEKASASQASPAPSPRALWPPRLWSRKMKLTVAATTLFVCAAIPAIAVPLHHKWQEDHVPQVVGVVVPVTHKTTSVPAVAVTTSSSTSPSSTSTSTSTSLSSTITTTTSTSHSSTSTTSSTTSIRSTTTTSSSSTTTKTTSSSSTTTTSSTSTTHTTTSSSSTTSIKTTSTTSATPIPTASIAAGTALRVMPLGASITYGWESSDGNGYRDDLRKSIVAGGDTLNFVGSVSSGTMVDNQVEGWPGYRVEQVYAKAQIETPLVLPNVILLNVGTNDCVQNYYMTTFGSRMSTLLDYLYATSPGSTIILSTLIINLDAATEARVEDANTQIVALYNSYAAAGKKIVLADMHTAAGPDSTTMSDQTHPNDVGYARMAAIWYQALIQAGKKGFVTKAATVSPAIPADGGGT